MTVMAIRLVIRLLVMAAAFGVAARLMPTVLAPPLDDTDDD
jgi:hypothetical protein